MKWFRLLCALLFSTCATAAQAAATFSCSLGAPPNYTQTYSAQTNSSTALSVTVTCVKSGSGGGKTVNYTVIPNNGLHSGGTPKRALFSGQFINYDLYTDSSCTIPWSGSGSITLPGGGGGTTVSQTLNYFGCVPASQPTLPAVGTYTDTVTMTLAIVADPTVTITGTNPSPFTTLVTVNATCALSTTPGPVNFGTYTAFQGTTSTANTSFTTTCTNGHGYSMSLDTYSGVVTGLNYSLVLGTAVGSGSPGTLGATGTGAAQTFYINGNMPANQAGTCPTGTCLGSNVHTLTITY